MVNIFNFDHESEIIVLFNPIESSVLVKAFLGTRIVLLTIVPERWLWEKTYLEQSTYNWEGDKDGSYDEPISPDELYQNGYQNYEKSLEQKPDINDQLLIFALYDFNQIIVGYNSSSCKSYFKLRPKHNLAPFFQCNQD